MIVMWLLIILFAIALWFFCAFVFYPFGKFFARFWNEAIREMERDDKEDKDKEKDE